ncbi:MAG: dihydroneopterin aldolase [Bacteroidetes bacterium]|nr:dihydroneopterin aldolase [Bacteroidota bacterium]
MYSVTLQNVSFFAYHGLYPEEAVNGNTFEVDLTLCCDYHQPIQTIEETVDYVAVYELLKTEMAIPRLLLETLAEDICEKIHTSFPSVHTININIRKMHPPIPGFTGQVGVGLVKEYIGRVVSCRL